MAVTCAISVLPHMAPMPAHGSLREIENDAPWPPGMQHVDNTDGWNIGEALA